MEIINKITFTDGELILQKDKQGNYLLCAIGATAHSYYYKFSKIAMEKLPLAFEKFNDCTLLV